MKILTNYTVKMYILEMEFNADTIFTHTVGRAEHFFKIT